MKSKRRQNLSTGREIRAVVASGVGMVGLGLLGRGTREP